MTLQTPSFLAFGTWADLLICCCATNSCLAQRQFLHRNILSCPGIAAAAAAAVCMPTCATQADVRIHLEDKAASFTRVNDLSGDITAVSCLLLL
jgi:hypothetical protein